MKIKFNTASGPIEGNINKNAFFSGFCYMEMNSNDFTKLSALHKCYSFSKQVGNERVYVIEVITDFKKKQINIHSGEALKADYEIVILEG